MIRVQTRAQDGALLFIRDDGAKALHPCEFTHNGIDYYLLGGVYYDLEQDLIDRIFN